MSLQDPIADLFTRIRNGQKAKKFSIVCQKSSFKVSILNLLVRHGYLAGFKDTLIDGKPGVELLLKYVAAEPAISETVRKSKPSLRRYSGFDDIEDMYGHHPLHLPKDSRHYHVCVTDFDPESEYAKTVRLIENLSLISQYSFNTNDQNPDKAW